MTTPRYVCIHGHFYQPPRENPWLEAIEVQDSAAPYHDWNERITRECYAPNTRSRLVDGQGKIVGLLNNYAWMSFNFGPTLVSWMAEHAPDVLRGIVEGDRVSRQRHRGHGNALAQVSNHMILPLVGERDKKTQVLWGLADFRHRFGREPEGMWLAETAADVASLEALAAAGIKFTILAPGQARRWRKIGDKDWTAIPDGIDPSRAYLARLPSGNTIVLFFYDGPIARQVAFERLLDSGEKFLARLMQGFDDERTHAQLVHIATDGESYGHHHPFGDMALAYVLNKLGQDADLRLTNYGEYLELHPPEWEVEIHENSSWSCAHGVERWRSNCGCRMRGDWQQEWRGPLRQAFDLLKERLDALFTTRARQCFPDPWAARDAYIQVILDRSPENVKQFLSRHGYPDLDQTLVREGLWLLEMQRHGMLMYTSCGWFFDEISGIETVQCLRYAARAIQLAAHFELRLESEFVPVLEKAPSNLPRFRNGRGVWEKLVRPWQIDLDRVLAHHAISSIYAPHEPHARIYCYDLDCLDEEVQGRGTNHVAIGRLHVQSRLTTSRAETNFVVIHYGGLDFYTVLRKERSVAEYEAFKKRLLDTYAKGSLADVTALVTSEFKGDVRRLEDLFQDEQRRIIRIALHDRFEDYQATFERLANQDQDLLNRLARVHYPIPKPFWMAATAYLDFQLREEIDRLGDHGNLARVRDLVERGQLWGYQPEKEPLAKTLLETLQRLLADIGPQTDLAPLIDKANQLLDAARLLELTLDPWQAQNRLLDVHAQLAESGGLREPLRQALVTLAEKLNMTPGLLGWRP
jgi:alpha-amylase/alpha-mannosidase (GH57 family)